MFIILEFWYFRIIQICKSIGLKRSGGHQRPVDQDGTKKTFGKM